MVKKLSFSPDQENAANPSKNVWVQANAGTGKTCVLVQRLLRILFRCESVSTTGILCLTYTNAAAGEMRNRILDSLREWAMAPDQDLKILLSGISTNTPPTDQDLIHARKIFYTYIDNPDILKVKTIHGFCEEILRRFPTEAGISPSWGLLSETTQKILLQETFSGMINSPIKNDTLQSRANDAFIRLVGCISEFSLDKLLSLLSGQYKQFFDMPDIDTYREYFVDTTMKFLKLDTPISVEYSVEKLKKILEIISGENNTPNYLNKVKTKTEQFIENTIDFNLTS